MAPKEAVVLTEHDMVADAIVREYEKVNFETWKNTDAPIKESCGAYPDVVVAPPHLDEYYHFEVETAETLNEDTLEKWRDYGDRFPFVLIVPHDKVADVRIMLVELNNAFVSLLGYVHLGDGRVKLIPAVEEEK